jgi:hypothetical protein
MSTERDELIIPFFVYYNHHAKMHIFQYRLVSEIVILANAHPFIPRGDATPRVWFSPSSPSKSLCLR